MIFGAPARDLCHLAAGELEQIQFLLGHVSVQAWVPVGLTQQRQLLEPAGGKGSIRPLLCEDYRAAHSLSSRNRGV
jgi:hypothetical protein